MVHVDDFIEEIAVDDDPKYGDVVYARWMFMHFRLPAHMRMSFDRFIAGMALFCTWEGKRWRCTGCSRFGDVWLTSDFNQSVGYEKRVDVADCTEWGSINGPVLERSDSKS